MEKWKKCYGYEDFIEVSNRGRVRTLGRWIEVNPPNAEKYSRYIEPRYLTTYTPRKGYPQVKVSLGNSKSKTLRVHRIMMETFRYVDSMRELEVNHIDGNKKNNLMNNLEWVTSKENTEHAIREGLFIPEIHSGNRKHPELDEVLCKCCGASFKPCNRTRKYCGVECVHKERSVSDKPSREMLYGQLKEFNFNELGEIYGVTSNTIRSWCKKLGISTDPKQHDTALKRRKFSEKMSKVSRESSTNKKRIRMLDKESGEYLREFESIASAAKHVKGSRKNIKKSIKGIEGRKSAYGYKWEFAEDA